jgi:hypothetical protein
MPGRAIARQTCATLGDSTTAANRFLQLNECPQECIPMSTRPFGSISFSLFFFFFFFFNLARVQSLIRSQKEHQKNNLLFFLVFYCLCFFELDGFFGSNSNVAFFFLCRGGLRCATVSADQLCEAAKAGLKENVTQFIKCDKCGVLARLLLLVFAKSADFSPFASQVGR